MTKPATAEKLKPFANPAQNRCFGCGHANAGGLQLEFSLTEHSKVVCRTTLGENFEGPRGFVHGGIIATLLDETMSKAVRAHGVVAMTRRMEVDYKRPVPSTEEIRIEGRVTRKEGRKHWTEASILDPDGKQLAHAQGLFIEVKVRPDPDPVVEEPAPHG